MVPTIVVVNLKSGAMKQFPGGDFRPLAVGNHVAWIDGTCNSPADSPDAPWCKEAVTWSVKILDMTTGEVTTALTATSSQLGYWPDSFTASAPSPLRPTLGLTDDGIVSVVEDPSDPKSWTIEALDFGGRTRWSLPHRGPIDDLTAAGSTVVWHEMTATRAGSPLLKGDWAGAGHRLVLFGAPGQPRDLGQPNDAIAGPGYALVSQVGDPTSGYPNVRDRKSVV
jgi:hypothetical protein